MRQLWKDLRRPTVAPWALWCVFSFGVGMFNLAEGNFWWALANLVSLAFFVSVVITDIRELKRKEDNMCPCCRQDGDDA